MFTVVCNVFFELLLDGRHFHDCLRRCDVRTFRFAWCQSGKEISNMFFVLFESVNKIQFEFPTVKPSSDECNRGNFGRRGRGCYIGKDSENTFCILVYTHLPVINSSLTSFASSRSHFDFINEGFISRFLSILACYQPLGCIISLLQHIWMGWRTAHKGHASEINNRDIFVRTTLTAQSRHNSTFTND